MKKLIPLFVVLFVLSFTVNAQKTFSEGVLVYNMDVKTGAGQPKMADMFDGATNTVYLKGNLSRVELSSGLGKEVTIHDADRGTATILKDYSGQKLMITQTPDDWKSSTQLYSGITFQPTGKKSKINDFDCIEAVAKLKNGTEFTVWYTPDIKVGNKSYDVQFENLPGLPIRYEMTKGNMKFTFTLAKITYGNVSAAMFQAPTSGYRIMTYQETLKK